MNLVGLTCRIHGPEARPFSDVEALHEPAWPVSKWLPQRAEAVLEVSIAQFIALTRDSRIAAISSEFPSNHGTAVTPSAIEDLIDIKMESAYVPVMRITANFKKMLATVGAITMATAALAAGTALTYNLAGKMIQSCYCQSMGGRMVCSGTCQAAGECCCCTPQMNE